MKKYLIYALSLGFIACTNAKNDSVQQKFSYVESQLTEAVEVVPIKIKEAKSNKTLVSPRSIDPSGNLILVEARDWCSGFFPGTLWYMYEYSNDKNWEREAQLYTNKLESIKNYSSTHDLGFIMYCSFGNGYRLTKNTVYRDILLQTTKTLANRYSSIVKSIRSWDFNAKEWKFPVIIDNMMNLELLYWASKETKDPQYAQIATEHARTTMRNHFREDGSSYHVVDYDPETGEVRMKVTHQGYSDDSAWARGQAWALYGFTMCYRESGEPEFLDMANKVANYIFTHDNLPNDLIPYWDFNAPNIPNEVRDVSAASIIASALYELSQYSTDMKKQYIEWADTIIDNLDKSYRISKNPNYGFILDSSTGAKMFNTEVNVPISYADYYYVESLIRKSKID